MKFIQALSLVSLVTVAHACLALDGTYDLVSTEISAIITDNGKQTCTFNGKVDDKQISGTCIATFSSYITGDIQKLFYSNDGHVGTLDIHMSLNNDHETQLRVRAYGC